MSNKKQRRNLNSLDKLSLYGNKPENSSAQRGQANARERARMRILSSAFGRLKARLPNIPFDTKLSKLDTLRLAVNYIQLLTAILRGENNYLNSTLLTSQENYETWPFILSSIYSYNVIKTDEKRGLFMKNW